MAGLDRTDIVQLLGRLGAQEQDTVVEAARELHRKVSESGLTWDDLLRARLEPAGTRHDAEGDDAAADEPLHDEPVEDGGAASSPDTAEATRLIGRLLARKDISDVLREDSTEMKRSIAEGSFEAMDRRYVRALAKRLGVLTVRPLAGPSAIARSADGQRPPRKDGTGAIPAPRSDCLPRQSDRQTWALSKKCYSAKSKEPRMSQAAQKRDAKPTAIKDADFNWEDPPRFSRASSPEEERMVRDTARGYAQDKLFPRVLTAFRDERYDPEIVREMGELGLLGPTIPEEYGGAGLGHVAYGLITREIERVDSGYRSSMSVQSSLVMHPIFAYGSEAQAQEISAQARDRRMGRLLRPDRARPRVRPWLDGDARREGDGRLQAHRQQDVDHQFAGGRRRGGLGQARRRHPRVPGGAREQGLLDAEDRGQADRCAPRSPARSYERHRCSATAGSLLHSL